MEIALGLVGLGSFRAAFTTLFVTDGKGEYLHEHDMHNMITIVSARLGQAPSKSQS